MRWAGPIGVLLLTTGCATFGYRYDGMRMHSLVGEANAAGFALEDPLEMDAEMKEAARMLAAASALEGSEVEKLQRLNRWLRGSDGLSFTYDALATRTAKDAFHARSGDCLSYAHLFTAMARHMGVSVGYVRYREAQSYDERNGQFTMVSHVASVFTNYRITIFVELSGTPTSNRVSDYETVGDDEALALHASNLAMERFSHGERKEPEALLRFLVTKAPRLPELHNNLAAVLLREGKAFEANAVLEPALKRFPDYVPLYVNGSLAARRVGDEERSEILAEKARSSDPFMPFVRGAWLFEKGKYQAAEQLIGKARSMRPESVTFTAWLARAQLLSGKPEEARAMFAEARKLAPTHPLIEELEKKHPELMQ